MRTRSLARTLGILGAILILLGSLFTLVFGLATAALHESFEQGIGASALAIEQGVVGFILLFFATISGSRQSEFAVAGGVILLVESLVALIVLGGGVLVVIGLILTLIAGILFLVPSR